MKLIKIISCIWIIQSGFAFAKNEVLIRNTSFMPVHWHVITSGKDHNGDIPAAQEHTFRTDNFLEKIELTYKFNQKPDSMHSFKFPAGKQTTDWNISISGNPRREWSIVHQEKKLYEILIGNNTNQKMHWHIKTTGKDNNGDINPGDVHYYYTNDLLDRLEITFTNADGKQENRGYKIPGLYSGKDWIFSVSGTPFGGAWSVCGSWAHTKTQDEATLSMVVIGAVFTAWFGGEVLGASAAASEASTAAAPGVSAAINTANLAIEAANINAWINGGAEVLASIPELAPTTAAAGNIASAGSFAVTSSPAIAGATTAATVTEKPKQKSFILPRQMHKDKCEWYGK